MKKVVILSASHRVRSTSAAIGEYLKSRIASAGSEVEHVNLAASGAMKHDFSSMIGACKNAAVLLLVSPLYHDAPSWLALEALCHVSAHRAIFGGSERPGFIAILHSGYPEPVHCAVAMEVCRQFASEADFEWLGGLSRGASSLIDGQPLEKLGFMTRSLRKGLDLAAVAAATGSPVPAAAVGKAAKVPLPRFLFVPVGNLMMWREARRRKVKDLHARPFAD